MELNSTVENRAAFHDRRHKLVEDLDPRPVHVVHIIETLGSGGAERLLYINLNHLDRSRFRHTVVVMYDRGTHWNDAILKLGIPIHRLGLSRPRDVLTGSIRLWRLLRLLRSERPDIVHTHLWTSDVAGRVAARLAGVPVISSAHNVHYEPEALREDPNINRVKRWLSWLIDRITTHFCDWMITPSEYVKQSIHRRLGFPSDRITVVYNPVDIPELDASSRSHDDILQEFGLSPDSRILLHVGRVMPQKGLIYAVRAMPALLSQFQNLHFISAGAAENEAYLLQLKDCARSLGVESHVHFLGSRRDIPDLLRACNVFVFPSVYEGLGMALIEAMAAGRACVAAEAGPIPEVIQHGVNGLLVPPRSVEALAAAVTGLLENPGRREALGQAAALSVRERFQPEVLTERLSEVYSTVVAAAR